MAKRPIFIPDRSGCLNVLERDVEFKWFPGLAKTQKQKSIESLHEAAKLEGLYPVLEVSSKSDIYLGESLSAFNLMISTQRNKNTFSVESAFQSSKVFERGGPYVDLLNKSSMEAKKDIRLRDSGNLTGFCFFGKVFPLVPKTLFYDWIYINALNRNERLAKKVLGYEGFTDIEFNPKKSINCQAFSVALFVSLSYSALLAEALKSPADFSRITSDMYDGRDPLFSIQRILL